MYVWISALALANLLISGESGFLTVSRECACPFLPVMSVCAQIKVCGSFVHTVEISMVI